MKNFVFAGTAMMAIAGLAQADFSEGFEGAAPGWQIKNASVPLGSTTWSIASNSTPPPFLAHAGTHFAQANYNATGSVGTISCWLFSPVDTISNGDKFSFWTRTVSGSIYPDRIKVRLSSNGASTDTGAGANGVGDFGNLLLDLNPTYDVGGYPEDWTQYTLTVSGLSGTVSGRFAIQYYVENGGGLGDNSNYIGVDDVDFKHIPTPGALAMLGLGGLVAGRRRR